MVSVRRLITVVSAPLLLVNAALPGFIAELHSQGEKIKLEKILQAASTLATPPAIVAFVGLFYFAFGGRVFGRRTLGGQASVDFICVFRCVSRARFDLGF